MTDPSRQAAYEAARASYDRVVIGYGATGHRAGHHEAILAAVDAVWDLAVAEGERRSRALSPEVAEVVADMIERWEQR